MQRLKQIPGVQEVMIANWFQGTFRDNRDPKNQFARFAVEPEKLFTIFGEWKIPEEEKQAWIRDRTGCVIGRDIAKNFNFKVGDKIHIVGDIYPGDFEFTIRGIFDAPTASRLMYFNKEYIDQALPERRRGQVQRLVRPAPSRYTRTRTALDSAAPTHGGVRSANRDPLPR